MKTTLAAARTATLCLAIPLCLIVVACQHPAPAPPPAAALAPGNLHSPWDSQPVKPSDIPFDCGPAAPVGPDITISGTLEDSSKQHLSEDVKSAVYLQSTAALKDLSARVVQAADVYRNTGSRAAAQCAANLIASAAASRAMTGYMSSNDAWLEQNNALHALSIAWLKIRGADPASPQDTQLILTWFDNLVRMERTFYERARCGENTCYIKSHRGLGTAMAAATVGIAENNYGLFHWAVSQYHTAAGEINARGMLHYDSRGRYAFKNNLRSAAYMVQIAELAETNNEPLYGYDHGSIHLLVHTVALGVVSPSPYRAFTHTAQVTPKGIQPWEIAWATVYNRRFPDQVVTSLLQQIGPGGVDMWGGEPYDPDDDPSL
jgi:poly(beta-D-mannuronate) lyase